MSKIKKEHSKLWVVFIIRLHFGASFENLDINLFDKFTRAMVKAFTRAMVKVFFQLALLLFQVEVKLQEKKSK